MTRAAAKARGGLRNASMGSPFVVISFDPTTGGSAFGSAWHVGWVERSETHRVRLGFWLRGWGRRWHGRRSWVRGKMMGFASLNPSYARYQESQFGDRGPHHLLDVLGAGRQHHQAV